MKVRVLIQRASFARIKIPPPLRSLRGNASQLSLCSVEARSTLLPLAPQSGILLGDDLDSSRPRPACLQRVHGAPRDRISASNFEQHLFTSRRANAALGPCRRRNAIHSSRRGRGMARHVSSRDEHTWPLHLGKSEHPVVGDGDQSSRTYRPRDFAASHQNARSRNGRRTESENPRPQIHNPDLQRSPDSLRPDATRHRHKDSSNRPRLTAVKFRRASLIATTLLLLLFLRDQTQAQPGSDTSLPPHAAPSQAQPGEVLWYGKAPPGLDEGVGPMKLVAPGVGWAQRGRRLYWTSDNCTSWKDITPPIDIGAVFFLDTQKGWAAADNGGRSPSSDDLPLEVASTTDAGANWSVTHVSLSLKDYDLSHNDVSHYETELISFADTSHGWMDVRVDGQTMNLQWNFLLVTSNGGRTW